MFLFFRIFINDKNLIFYIIGDDIFCQNLIINDFLNSLLNRNLPNILSLGYFTITGSLILDLTSKINPLLHLVCMETHIGSYNIHDTAVQSRSMETSEPK